MQRHSTIHRNDGSTVESEGVWGRALYPCAFDRLRPRVTARSRRARPGSEKFDIIGLELGLDGPSERVRRDEIDLEQDRLDLSIGEERIKTADTSILNESLPDIAADDRITELHVCSISIRR